MIQGSSGWILGQNLTRKCNIVHIGGNALLLPNGDELSQTDAGHHSYVLLNSFLKPDIRSSSLLCLSASPSTGASDILDNWAKLSRVVHQDNRHTCGYALYFDTRKLLTGNGLWNDQVQQYLASIVAEC